jgi:hypothetical protein
VPPARLLSLLNVKYVITDKTQDVWLDGTYYDLEHSVSLGEVSLTDLPAHNTTHLGVVSYLTGTVDLENGTPVANLIVTSTEGVEIALTLLAGQHTSEGLYTNQPVAPTQARVGHHWRDNEQGNDYMSVLGLGQSLIPKAIAIQSLLPGEKVHLRGLTLIDETSGTSRNLSIDPSYRLVHSGDVKIYENLTVLPRAFVVHKSVVAESDEQALNYLRTKDLDPSDTVVLREGLTLDAEEGRSTARIVSYEPHEVQLEASLDSPGYLILTDTHYPGWTAAVDGQEAPIVLANLYLRAVLLEPGEHTVTFQFKPQTVRQGLIVGALSWLAWVLVVAIVASRTGRKPASGV